MTKIAIHPQSGFLNTNYSIHIVSDSSTNDQGCEIIILNDNITTCSDEDGEADPQPRPLDIISIPPGAKYLNYTFPCAGVYTLHLADSGENVKVEVRDAIRFGGSTFKDCFIFDETPWCFVVMRDRTYFYNRETKEQYVEHISPDSIEVVNKNVVLLKNKDKETSLYSLANHRPFANYLIGAIVKSKWLIAEDMNTSNKLIIIDFDEDIISKNTLDSEQYLIDENNENVYTIFDNHVSTYSLGKRTSNSKDFDSHESVICFTDRHYFILHNSRRECFAIYNVLDYKMMTYIISSWPISSICGHEIFNPEDGFDIITEAQYKIPSRCIQIHNSVIKDICVANNKVYYSETDITRYVNKYNDKKRVFNYCVRSDGKIIFDSNDRYIVGVRAENNQINIQCKGEDFIVSDNDEVVEVTDNTTTTFTKNQYDNLPTLPEHTKAYTSSRKLAITVRGSYIRLCRLNGNSYEPEEILSSLYDSSSYYNTQVFLSDDGENIVYQCQEEFFLKNVTTGDESSFPSTEFITHHNGYRPLFSLDSHRKPRLIDPITRQNINEKYLAEYCFTSPDGRFYAETRQIIKPYHRLREEFISDAEYDKIMLEYEVFPKNGELTMDKQNEIINKRKALLAKYPTKTWNIDIKCYDIRPYIIEKRGFVNIRKRDINELVAEIPIGIPLWFLNYVSFSYDSRYAAIAGRYHDNILPGGLLLIYDLVNKKVIRKEPVRMACWRTMFTKAGLVASYSSDPNTYVGLVTEMSLVESHGVRCDDCTDNFVKLSGKNLLTFSPDGKYMALSNQGYVRYNGGVYGVDWGHMPSTSVFVCEAKSPYHLICPEINDLSDSGIQGSHATKTAVSCSFSIDNKKLMMVGSDGVVIIRNLHIQ